MQIITAEQKRVAREALLGMVHLAKISKTPMHFMERVAHLVPAAMGARELTDEQILTLIDKSEEMLGFVEEEPGMTQPPGLA